MNSNFETFGTLAIKPCADEPQGAVIPFDWYLGSAPAEKSEVECMLDDFDGSLTAKTSSDRRFLGAALAIAAVLVFVFSFAPIL